MTAPTAAIVIRVPTPILPLASRFKVLGTKVHAPSANAIPLRVVTAHSGLSLRPRKEPGDQEDPGGSGEAQLADLPQPFRLVLLQLAVVVSGFVVAAAAGVRHGAGSFVFVVVGVVSVSVSVWMWSGP